MAVNVLFIGLIFTRARGVLPLQGAARTYCKASVCEWSSLVTDVTKYELCPCTLDFKYLFIHFFLSIIFVVKQNRVPLVVAFTVSLRVLFIYLFF